MTEPNQQQDEPTSGDQRRIAVIRKAAATGDPYERCLTRFAAQVLLAALDSAQARVAELEDLQAAQAEVADLHRARAAELEAERELLGAFEVTIRCSGSASDENLWLTCARKPYRNFKQRSMALDDLVANALAHAARCPEVKETRDAEPDDDATR